MIKYSHNDNEINSIDKTYICGFSISEIEEMFKDILDKSITFSYDNIEIYFSEKTQGDIFCKRFPNSLACKNSITVKIYNPIKNIKINSKNYMIDSYNNIFVVGNILRSTYSKEYKVECLDINNDIAIFQDTENPLNIFDITQEKLKRSFWIVDRCCSDNCSK